MVWLDWIREKKAVPVCGGKLREAYRAVASLSTSQAGSSVSFDGSVDFHILPGSQWSQRAGVVGAFMAGIGLTFGLMAHLANHDSWLPYIIAGGGVAGVLAAPGLIRRHPAVVLRSDRGREWLIADEGRLRLECSEIKQLVLVTGKNPVAVPGHGGMFVGSGEVLNGTLLAVRRSDAADHAVLLFRHALPGRAMRKIARMASAELGLPLEEINF